MIKRMKKLPLSVRSVSRVLYDQGGLLPTSERIELVKRLVAAMPMSANEICKLLCTFSVNGIYEVHFTLFCYLDNVVAMPDCQAIRATVCNWIAEYLRFVPQRTALAAWMAGDLLGDHWPLREGLSALSDAILHAKYVAGRYGAIHGLKMAHRRSGIQSRRTIMKILSEASINDRSGQVRRAAAVALEHCEKAGLEGSRNGDRAK
jgi:hypothetical protein